MSTLWTPGGEVPVNRNPSGRNPSGTPPVSDIDNAINDDINDGGSYGAPVDPAEADDGVDAEVDGGLNLDDLSPEERERAEQAIRELAETREQILATPASVIVANHCMGLYELAALHLSQREPNFAEAAIAIDALGLIIDGLKGRLGDDVGSSLNEALGQLRGAFVGLKQQAAQASNNDDDMSSDDINNDDIDDGEDDDVNIDPDGGESNDVDDDGSDEDDD